MAVEIYPEAKANILEMLDEPLVEVIARHDWEIFCPEGHDEQDAYEHMRRGKCMLCGEVLGEDTVIIVDAQGILGIWCQGQCLIDTHAISFLEDLLVEMVAKYENNEEEEE